MSDRWRCLRGIITCGINEDYCYPTYSSQFVSLPWSSFWVICAKCHANRLHATMAELWPLKWLSKWRPPPAWILSDVKSYLDHLVPLSSPDFDPRRQIWCELPGTVTELGLWLFQCHCFILKLLIYNSIVDKCPLRTLLGELTVLADGKGPCCPFPRTIVCSGSWNLIFGPSGPYLSCQYRKFKAVAPINVKSCSFNTWLINRSWSAKLQRTDGVVRTNALSHKMTKIIITAYIGVRQICLHTHVSCTVSTSSKSMTATKRCVYKCLYKQSLTPAKWAIRWCPLPDPPSG